MSFKLAALLGRFDNDTKGGEIKGVFNIENDYEDINNVEESHPDFSIPVSVHVTDVNDNTPQFAGQTPYLLNISELTLVRFVFILFL